MNELARILRAFGETDGSLENYKPRAKAGAIWSIESVEGWQRINNQAYFVLVFAQFEKHVTAAADTLLQRARQSENMAVRRLSTAMWDLKKRSISGMPFKDRLALVLDKGSAEYAYVLTLADKRHSIAHGTVRTDYVDPVEAAERLSAIAAKIQDPP